MFLLFSTKIPIVIVLFTWGTTFIFGNNMFKEFISLKVNLLLSSLLGSLQSFVYHQLGAELSFSFLFLLLCVQVPGKLHQNIKYPAYEGMQPLCKAHKRRPFSQWSNANLASKIDKPIISLSPLSDPRLFISGWLLQNICNSLPFKRAKTSIKRIQS